MPVEECIPAGAKREYAVLEYTGLAGFPGRVIFSCHCKSYVVDSIILEPEPLLPLEKALSTYGPGACYRRFILTDDPNDPDSLCDGRSEEHPRGNVVLLEYRRLGIVLYLAFDQFSKEERVSQIWYTKKPS